MNDLFGPKEIKKRVKNYINEHGHLFNGKTVVDIPAGNGYTTGLLLDAGAKVMAVDLIPEFFTETRAQCIYGDLNKKLNIEDSSADIVFFQEGIEHLENPLQAFRELNRVLKTGGTLFLTTPNVSKLKSRVSHFLFETETIGRRMPPNEIDTVWLAKNHNDIYFGHLFLTGIQKLRTFGAVTGFALVKAMGTRLNLKSLYYFVVFYPFILISSVLSYFRNIKKLKNNEADLQRKKNLPRTAYT
ncbi:MAG: class I SAM-dependent methyltransferase [Bacteroidales bacterium]|nr:class I SAM-dependent methyltransferase [Bacteroidales bacterium]